jgi:DNA invertase Pin-like site-specific DNA recombinase
MIMSSQQDRQMTKTNKPLKAALYARVSTGSQSTENQLSQLREAAERLGWVVVAEFVDHGISGAKGRKDRPQLDAMLKGVSRKEFDVVASWSVDRLGRSLNDLVGLLQELHSTGIDLYLHQQGINTTTTGGKAMFQMMGVFAEFEREMIRDRVLAGLAVVKTTGKNKHGQVVTLGRPKVSAKVEAQVKALRDEGLGILKIAKTVGCGVSVVQRLVA